MEKRVISIYFSVSFITMLCFMFLLCFKYLKLMDFTRAFFVFFCTWTFALLFFINGRAFFSELYNFKWQWKTLRLLLRRFWMEDSKDLQWKADFKEFFGKILRFYGFCSMVWGNFRFSRLQRLHFLDLKWRASHFG